MSRSYSSGDFGYPNRTICSVLEAMRDAIKTLNFSYLGSLIEEAQFLANRMESALYDSKDIKKLMEMRAELKKECAELEKQVEALKAQLPKKDEQK